MNIHSLPDAQLDRILPLLEQVQALHCAQQPHRYRAFAHRSEVFNWLVKWVRDQQVKVLISGPMTAPTGYLAYVVISQPASVIRPSQHYALLEHICVDKAHRGNGHARALIAAMRAALRADGVSHVRARHAAWNTASATLLKSEGFAVSALEVEAAIL